MVVSNIVVAMRRKDREINSVPVAIGIKTFVRIVRRTIVDGVAAVVIVFPELPECNQSLSVIPLHHVSQMHNSKTFIACAGFIELLNRITVVDHPLTIVIAE